MRAVSGDPERVEVIAKARMFKRSWIELADALSAVSDRQSWTRWGYESFESYCKKELHLSPATALKLLGSFRFLQTSAPRIVERALTEPSAPIPSQRAVDFVARAEQRGAANEEALREIRRAAFDESADAPALSRRFKSVAFPVAESQAEEQLRGRLASAAQRLAALIAEPASPVPRKVAIAVEEALGQLMESLDGAA